jgi:hypothetical protein
MRFHGSIRRQSCHKGSVAGLDGSLVGMAAKSKAPIVPFMSAAPRPIARNTEKVAPVAHIEIFSEIYRRIFEAYCENPPCRT